MYKNQTWLLFILLMLFNNISSGQDELLEILQDELNREMKAFQKEKYKPYFLSYRVNDDKTTTISSSFGSTTRIDTSHQRRLNVSLRVGDHKKDNTHASNNGKYSGRSRKGPAIIPIENKKEAIAQVLWLNTDAVYKSAVENYKNLNFQTEKEKADTLSDFSIEKAETYVFKSNTISNPDIKKWEVRLNKLSDKFNANNNFISGDVNLNYKAETKYFVSSEGAKIAQQQSYCYLQINGIIRATDGMICPLSNSYFGFTPEELPSEQQLLEDMDKLIERMMNLRNAPLAEPYEGPAILSPKAAGVFFHEIFGHRIEGHRTRQKTDSQTFNEKLGEYVLPKGFNVVFDPTLKKQEGHLLSGNYIYDDEGVKGQKVTIVTNGILNEFLTSRCPISSNSNSNGHGRAMAGATPVTRQSNMLVYSENPYSEEKLRKQLIKACKKLKKPYGYLFQEVSGGFTMVSRFAPNAFNVNPLEVYRVFTDGRPDQLVRGVSLIGTPLAMFAEIESAGTETDVFNGFCGAESGSVPVSTIAPALFVKQVETQKKIDIESNETILNRPGLNSQTQIAK